MNTTTLTDGISIEVQLSPLRFYIAGKGDIETVLEVLDDQGAPLPDHRWVRDSASWVLDPIGLDVHTLRLVARSAHGTTYPARTTIQCTAVGGGQQYLAVFDDLAGRSSRDLLLVDVQPGSLRLARARRHTPSVSSSGEAPWQARTETIRVLLDGSASMRAERTAAHVTKVVGALQDLVNDGRAADQLNVSWQVVRDGVAHPATSTDVGAELQQAVVSVGSVFEPHLFAGEAHHVVITDEVPAGLGTWSAQESTIMLLVVGAAGQPGKSEINGITVYVDDSGPDTTALIAELASGFGWDK